MRGAAGRSSRVHRGTVCVTLPPSRQAHVQGGDRMVVVLVAVCCHFVVLQRYPSNIGETWVLESLKAMPSILVLAPCSIFPVVRAGHDFQFGRKGDSVVSPIRDLPDCSSKGLQHGVTLVHPYRRNERLELILDGTGKVRRAPTTCIFRPHASGIKYKHSSYGKPLAILSRQHSVSERC